MCLWSIISLYNETLWFSVLSNLAKLFHNSSLPPQDSEQLEIIKNELDFIKSLFNDKYEKKIRKNEGNDLVICDYNTRKMSILLSFNEMLKVSF